MIKIFSIAWIENILNPRGGRAARTMVVRSWSAGPLPQRSEWQSRGVQQIIVNMQPKDAKNILQHRGFEGLPPESVSTEAAGLNMQWSKTKVSIFAVGLLWLKHFLIFLCTTYRYRCLFRLTVYTVCTKPIILGCALRRSIYRLAIGLWNKDLSISTNIVQLCP